MPTYHFDVGDSTAGPIGFCASVRAKSKEAALSDPSASSDSTCAAA